ncbi:MAG: ThuA domain-containing protein, partial [Planctomycetes bacterium]|nr:ThuA domain-containing protein [Planctomycetota bacterium]
KGREPWTWVRTHGKGRVFYTTWGHDHRTWGNAGFQNLLERGIRWAAGADLNVVPNYLADRSFPVPQMTAKRKDVKPFEFIDVGANIPNYTPGRRWGVQGAAISKMQKPISAEESLKHMVVPQGFRVELFASEPDIGGKPICMAWDERGRLWIAETYDYPNEQQPPGQGRDRIRICEDTDGDWKADKFTVFAEKLSIPTSITFHRGGVIVNNGTQTLFLKDTDGDDVADERRVIFSGWNQGDTHGGVSNFQYGLDNWIWAMQGYNNSEPVIDGEKQQSFRQGFFRFRPDGSQIEFLRSTDNNTWGLGISEEGIVFGSTANRNPSVYMPIPNRYYEAVRGWAPSLTLRMISDTHLFKPITENIRQVDHHGGYTAGAGHALYTARNYPQEYWNRTAFVNGPTGHLVGTFVLKRDGSDFRSTNAFNLLASDDEWTAPIMAEVGPDGNVWVIDWYNYIVQHNPTPRGFETGKGNAYLTDLRDKKHGRIYRVVYEAAKPVGPMSLKGVNPRKLIDTLKHDNMFWRKQAQRLLVERGKQDILPALIKLAGDQSVDEIGLNVGVIHALWTMHGLGALDGSHPESTAAAVAALKHPSAGVRRNAVKVLPRTAASTDAIVSGRLLNDSDAQVRLAAFLALADLPPSPAAGKAVVTAMNLAMNATDRWIPDAATSAAANNSENFLRALAGSKKPSAKLTEISGIVAEHYAREIPVDSVAGLAAKLNKADAAVADAVIKGLARGWPNGRKAKMNPSIEQDLQRLQSRLSPGSRGLFLKLASTWGSAKFEKYAKEVATTLLAQLDDKSLADDKRVAVARQIVEFQPLDEEAVTLLLDRVSPQTPPSVAIGIVRALRESESPQTGRLIVERFRSMTPSTRQAGISVLLSRSLS